MLLPKLAQVDAKVVPDVPILLSLKPAEHNFVITRFPIPSKHRDCLYPALPPCFNNAEGEIANSGVPDVGQSR